MGLQRGQGGSELPPVMRRSVAAWFACSVVLVLGAIAWVAGHSLLNEPRRGFRRFVPLVLGLAPLAIVTPAWLLRTRRIRRALRATDGRLCTHCAYDVSSLPAAGTCPECGGKYDAEKDRKLWENVGGLWWAKGSGA